MDPTPAPDTPRRSSDPRAGGVAGSPKAPGESPLSVAAALPALELALKGTNLVAVLHAQEALVCALNNGIQVPIDQSLATRCARIGIDVVDYISRKAPDGVRARAQALGGWLEFSVIMLGVDSEPFRALHSLARKELSVRFSPRVRLLLRVLQRAQLIGAEETFTKATFRDGLRVALGFREVGAMGELVKHVDILKKKLMPGKLYETAPRIRAAVQMLEAECSDQPGYAGQSRSEFIATAWCSLGVDSVRPVGVTAAIRDNYSLLCLANGYASTARPIFLAAAKQLHRVPTALVAAIEMLDKVPANARSAWLELGYQMGCAAAEAGDPISAHKAFSWVWMQLRVLPSEERAAKLDLEMRCLAGVLLGLDRGRGRSEMSVEVKTYMGAVEIKMKEHLDANPLIRLTHEFRTITKLYEITPDDPRLFKELSYYGRCLMGLPVTRESAWLVERYVSLRLTRANATSDDDQNLVERTLSELTKLPWGLNTRSAQQLFILYAQIVARRGEHLACYDWLNRGHFALNRDGTPQVRPEQLREYELVLARSARYAGRYTQATKLVVGLFKNWPKGQPVSVSLLIEQLELGRNLGAPVPEDKLAAVNSLCIMLARSGDGIDLALAYAAHVFELAECSEQRRLAARNVLEMYPSDPFAQRELLLLDVWDLCSRNDYQMAVAKIGEAVGIDVPAATDPPSKVRFAAYHASVVLAQAKAIEDTKDALPLYVKASELAKTAHQKAVSILGEDHPTTLCLLYTVGTAQVSTGDTPGALALLERLVDGLERLPEPGAIGELTRISGVYGFLAAAPEGLAHKAQTLSARISASLAQGARRSSMLNAWVHGNIPLT